MENRLSSTGYTSIRSSLRVNSVDSFCRCGGSCVDARTTFNPYPSLTHAT